MTTILCVDIQPEFEPECAHFIGLWASFLNERPSSDQIIFYSFNNGKTLSVYRDWLESHCKINAIIVRSSAIYVCKPEREDDFEDTIPSLADELARLTAEEQAQISALMSEFLGGTSPISSDENETWIKKSLSAEKSTDSTEVVDLDLEGKITHDDIILTGGFKAACLREVETRLMVMGKRYTIDDRFTF